MFNFIKNTISKLFKSNNSSDATNDNNNIKSIEFNKDFNKNIELIKFCLGKSDDLIFRYFNISTQPYTKAVVIYIESMVDDKSLQSSVLDPLINELAQRTTEDRIYLKSKIHTLIEQSLSISKLSFKKNLSEAINELVIGNSLLLIDKVPYVVSVNTLKADNKESTEPQTEKVVKGPQQGFVESINTNCLMLRRRIKSPNLIFKNFKVGRQTQTDIRIVYLCNIADLNIVDELCDRINRIDVDGFVSSASIEEYINDNPINLFHTTFYSERPDRVQSLLLEGRIAIICDGTPFVIIVPAIISDFFISMDDYYQNQYFASFCRLLGYFGAILLTFLPSIYVAITTFHQEVLPTQLALTIAAARGGVPYPAFIEAVIMEVAFEALRQAGTRLPTHIGQAVSIVGALIIGQAAVEAGLVSSIVVIIVAMTAIFSFTIPYTNFVLSLRLARFFMLVLAGILGIYGIMTGLLILALNLISLRSFGVPFMVPFAPLSLKELKDWFLRMPLWSITERSGHIVKKNIVKKDKNIKPTPPSK
ncbi:spore germination protein [Serpentinicella alkaliphila]|uniref:Spore germination protein KA n=1 Tax=Serpentinicella alkaliphila TaxID=1734049 RepID=A0A4R2TVN5_9FIRM|nr:spore germination protein [Serpentinicella alkaliphila]QUH25256.1 spore germination protein [Serpentinicella alkaliphila]TCQ07067.1 spore germination protein KA [Serpentinicella alkaliphila]